MQRFNRTTFLAVQSCGLGIEMQRKPGLLAARRGYWQRKSQ
jgi:hypothetical protein